MKRLLVVCSLVILGAFLVFSMVAAQTGAAAVQSNQNADPLEPSAITPRTSHTLVQNMEDVTANLHIEYWSDQGQMKHGFDDALPPKGAKTFHADAYSTLGPNFLGSMVVSSDRQIVAVVVNAGSTSHDIYEGSNQGDTEQFLPSVHWRSAQYTLAGFQNTDPSMTATVAISYFLQDGTLLNGRTVNIPPNSAVHDDARDITSHAAGVGAVKVTSLSGQRIAAAAIETLFDETYSYRGFPPSSGATKIYLPSMHRNLAGQFSHTLVQNMDPNNANNVRITYYNQAGAQVDTFVRSIPAKGSYTFHTNSGAEEPTHLGNVGSAIVTSESSLPMVAVVVETVVNFAYAYDGAIPADGASSLLFPSAHHNLGGQFSHTLIQNLSTTTNASLTVTYYNQSGSVANTFNYSLNPSGSFTFHTTPGDPYEPVGMGNVGSLRVTCTNCSPGGTQIVGVMVETLLSANITGAYAGFKEF